MSRVAVVVILAVLLGHVRTSRADSGGTAVATGSSSAAEQEFEVVRASSQGADDVRTEELARRFLVRFPRDPLAARVELELAKVELLRALTAESPEAAGSHLDESDRWLARCAARADAPTRLRASLYQGVVAFRRSDAARAVTLLEPIGGGLVDPDDRRLRDSTLFEACTAVGRLDCALDSLDAMRASCRDDRECTEIDERIAVFGHAEGAGDATVSWALTTDPSRPSWSAIASRSIRIAESHGDWTAVRAIAARAAEAQVVLDGEARAIAMRAERGATPSPRVIGVISGISGENAARAIWTVHAIAGAAEVPPRGRTDDSAYRFVVYDHHGAPAEAVRAVSDLVFVSRAIAIIGPVDPESARAAAERSQTIGVPFVSLAPIEESSFVFDATRARTVATARSEAERRFGADLALVVPRSVSRAEADEVHRFEHAGGRFDRATSERLRRLRARALYVESNPRELRRLVVSILSLLPRGPRVQRIPLVLSRTSFDALRDGGLARQLEGSIVLDVVDGERFREARESGREAFARIERADADTREGVAEALRAEDQRARTAPDAFVVRQGRLVPLP